MKEKTRYAYEKRIKELERKVCDLYYYKAIATEIYEVILDNRMRGNTTNEHWLLKKFSRVFK